MGPRIMTFLVVAALTVFGSGGASLADTDHSDAEIVFARDEDAGGVLATDGNDGDDTTDGATGGDGDDSASFTSGVDSKRRYEQSQHRRLGGRRPQPRRPDPRLDEGRPRHVDARPQRRPHQRRVAARHALTVPAGTGP